MKRRAALLSLFLFPILASCQQSGENGAPDTPAAPKTEAAAPAKVRLKTNKGDIVIELNAEKAPVTTQNFLNYVKNRHYDGTIFHRVINNFMIQGGGFALDGGRPVEKKTGNGIVNESNNGLRNLRGTIAMARTNDPNSATAQFFINVKDNASLDYPSMGGYAVFGKVVEGMEVVDKIRAVATGNSPLTMLHPSTGQALTQPSQDVPVEPVVIESATAE